MPTSDAYLLRKYGITLAERQAIVDEQGGKCAACGRVFDGTVRMEVDHEHFKITSQRIGTKSWRSTASFEGRILAETWSRTKISGVKAVRKGALRASVRGVLCGGRYAGCNRKLGRIDKVLWLQAVTAYLQDPPARRVIQKIDFSAPLC